MENNIKNKILSKWYILIFAIAIVAIVLLRIDKNPDVFFMIKHGEYLVKNNFDFPTKEILTIHSDYNFKLEKWLSCLTFYELYDKAGMAGIDILVAIMMLLSFIMFLKISKLQGKDEKPTMVGLLLFLIYVGIAGLKRPQIFSNLIFMIELYLLELFLIKKDKRYLYIVPILTLLLMQLHSTIFPIFFILAVPYLCLNLSIQYKDGKLIKETEGYNLKDIKILFIICGLCILAAMINPYGISSMFTVVKSQLSSGYNHLIVELDKITVLDYKNLLVAVYMLLIANSFFKEEKKIYIRHLVLLVICYVMFAQALRNIQFLLIATMFADRYLDREKNKKIVIAMIVMVLIYFVGIDIFSKMKLEVQGTKAPNDTEEMYRYYVGNIKEVIPEGSRIYVGFDCGPYLEFLGYKTYIDSRIEVFQKEINGKEDLIKEFENLEAGKTAANELQEKYNFEYWVVIKDTPLDVQMKLLGYENIGGGERVNYYKPTPQAKQ